MRQEVADAGVAVVKGAPVAVVGAKIAGYSLPDFAALLAIVYTAALLVQMAWRFASWLYRQWLKHRAPQP